MHSAFHFRLMTSGLLCVNRPLAIILLFLKFKLSQLCWWEPLLNWLLCSFDSINLFKFSCFPTCLVVQVHFELSAQNREPAISPKVLSVRKETYRPEWASWCAVRWQTHLSGHFKRQRDKTRFQITIFVLLKAWVHMDVSSSVLTIQNSYSNSWFYNGISFSPMWKKKKSRFLTI